jgi:hypothetical protein
MSKHTAIIVWAIEFASLTAIIVLLSTATKASKWWVALPEPKNVYTVTTSQREWRRIRQFSNTML